jgi:Ca2+:H+ antiporter
MQSPVEHTRNERIVEILEETRHKGLFRKENALLFLLVFVPVAIVVKLALGPGVLLFVLSCLAIVPLAGVMGRATEHLAARTSDTIGGLLNASLGNAAEMIIAVIALLRGHEEIVKASITGSIIGNILLVLGLAALAGGWKREKQTFNRVAAATGASMLFLSVAALVVPTLLFELHVLGPDETPVVRRMSVAISVILILTYAASLLFSLHTHKDALAPQNRTEEDDRIGVWPVRRSLIVLLIATAGVAVLAEFLVGSVEKAAESWGLSHVFVGVIVVAIVGNAAEHSSAILMALKNNMDLGMSIPIESSKQITMFVAPVLVLLGAAVGHPMDLHFTTFEVVAVALAVGAVVIIAEDGESNWIEGLQLLALYGILAVAFYFVR